MSPAVGLHQEAAFTGCLNGAMLYTRSRETARRKARESRAVAGLDEALPLLWTLVDEARSHGTLGLFLRMAKWIGAQSPRGGAHHESCSPS
jgi:hypothetical protein